jgi:hypothetical protein
MKQKKKTKAFGIRGWFLDICCSTVVQFVELNLTDSNIKPTAHKLNELIKRDEKNETIRSVVNNILAPCYKIAKHLNKSLNNLINLPYTYTTKNSCEIA